MLIAINNDFFIKNVFLEYIVLCIREKIRTFTVEQTIYVKMTLTYSILFLNEMIKINIFFFFYFD